MHYKNMYIPTIGGRDSAVGTETHFWLDGSEIEFPCWRDFPCPSRRAWGLPNPLFSGYRVSFLGV